MIPQISEFNQICSKYLLKLHILQYLQFSLWFRKSKSYKDLEDERIVLGKNHYELVLTSVLHVWHLLLDRTVWLAGRPSGLTWYHCSWGKQLINIIHAMYYSYCVCDSLHELKRVSVKSSVLKCHALQVMPGFFFFWEWILPLKHTNTIAANKVFSVFSVFRICRSFLLLVNWQGFSLAGGLWQKRTALVLLQHFFIASCSDSRKTFTEKKNNSQLKNGFTSPPLYNVHAANQVSDVLFVFIILCRGTEPVRQVPDKRQHPPSYCPVLQCTEASGSVLKWTPLFLTVFLEGFLFFK